MYLVINSMPLSHSQHEFIPSTNYFKLSKCPYQRVFTSRQSTISTSSVFNNTINIIMSEHTVLSYCYTYHMKNIDTSFVKKIFNETNVHHGLQFSRGSIILNGVTCTFN